MRSPAPQSSQPIQ
jgi:hypothetical protein